MLRRRFTAAVYRNAPVFVAVLFILGVMRHQSQTNSRLEYVLEENNIDQELNVGQGLSNSSSSNKVNVYKFIIMTKSAPSSVEARQFLRNESWLSYDWNDDRNKTISWRHFFLVGLSTETDWPRSKIEEENNASKDIIISETIDLYERLTYKLMWGLQHAIDKYKFKFLVILSEDTIVNVNGLNRYISRLIDDGRDRLFYGGPRCRDRKVLREGKWMTSNETYPANRYPTYCIGSGLIFSFDTIVELLRVWKSDRQPIHGLDDVHIGLLLHLSGKIAITDIKNITLGCKKNRSDSFILTQIKPLSKGAELMRNFSRHGVYCFQKVKKHKA